MTLRARTALAAALLATAAQGCGYDLARLGPRDGGTDATSPPDVVGACNGRTVVDPTREGIAVGPSVVVTGTTRLEMNALTPPMTEGCPLDYAEQPSPERVIRYVMREAGTLYATTDAPACEAVFDTVVHIRTSCEPDAGTVLACDDDDNVLDSCACAGGLDNCPTFASSTVAEGLAAGQTVFVVVDGFAGRAGNFRLVLTENAAVNAAPPLAGAGLMLADRCSCPSGADTMLTTVQFPAPGDVVTAMAPPRLALAGDRVSGTRMVSFTSIAGAAMEFRLSANTLGVGSGDAGCASTTAAMDLLANDVVLHSFVLSRATPVNAPVRVAFQTFAPVAVAGAVRFALQMREVNPARCGSVTVDTATAGTLTLLGH